MIAYRDIDAFLEAWLRGVELAGIQWFDFRRTFDDVTAVTKWDYRPDYEKIDSGISTMSHTGSAFIIAMYSFYNPTYADELAKKVSINMTPGRLAGLFGEEKRRVIADLTVSYEGW